MMKEIDSSEDPGKILVKAMQIPIFTEFVDECLRIVDEDELEMEHWAFLAPWVNTVNRLESLTSKIAAYSPLWACQHQK